MSECSPSKIDSQWNDRPELHERAAIMEHDGEMDPIMAEMYAIADFAKSLIDDCDGPLALMEVATQLKRESENQYDWTKTRLFDEVRQHWQNRMKKIKQC